MTNNAIITSIAGHDGAYLAKILFRKRYLVLDADRRSLCQVHRLVHLDISDAVERIDEKGTNTKASEMIVQVNPKFFLSGVRIASLGGVARPASSNRSS